MHKGVCNGARNGAHPNAHVSSLAPQPCLICAWHLVRRHQLRLRARRGPEVGGVSGRRAGRTHSGAVPRKALREASPLRPAGPRMASPACPAARRSPHAGPSPARSRTRPLPARPRPRRRGASGGAGSRFEQRAAPSCPARATAPSPARVRACLVCVRACVVCVRACVCVRV